MSDTPKTDAVEEAWDHLCLPRIIWNHARELERENAALLQDVRGLVNKNETLSAENATLRIQRNHYKVALEDIVEVSGAWAGDRARGALGKEAQP